MRIFLALSILIVSGCMQLNARHSGWSHHASPQHTYTAAATGAEPGIEHVSAFNKIARFDGEWLIFTLEATEITEEQHRRGLILQKKNQISHYFTAGFCFLTLNHISGLIDNGRSADRHSAFASANRRHLLFRVFQI